MEASRRTGSAPLAPAVREALLERADRDGFVPFEQFVDVALYGPRIGYYARPRTPFGAAGDFYTAPRVHPLFGRTLARRLAEVHAALGEAGPFQVVELGAGDGTLAVELVRELVKSAREGGLDYVLVDRSDARRRDAAARVRATAGEAGVEVREAATLGDVGPVRGAIVANELLDAQPVLRLRWDGETWKEVGFRLDGERLALEERSVRAPRPPPALPTPGRAGVVLDLAPAAEGLVREIADRLRAGLVVLIDYGAEENDLLAGRPGGTLSAIRSHRVVEPPWEAPGEADLSAFVDFDRVRAAARAAGLIELAYGSQAEALGAWGFEDELARALAASRSAEEEVRTRLAAKNLLFSFSNHRVLELATPGSAGSLARATSASRAAPP